MHPELRVNALLVALHGIAGEVERIAHELRIAALGEQQQDVGLSVGEPVLGRQL